MKRILLIGASLCSLLIAGCKAGDSSKSKIVAEVESAGSGSLNGLDEATIQGWLAQHSDVASRISPECKAAMMTAPADWGTTTEGRVCTAATQVLFYKPKDLTDGHY